MGVRHGPKRFTSLILTIILRSVLLIPYFLLYNGEQQAQRKAAICPVGGGIRAEISNSQAVAPGAPSSARARSPPGSRARSLRPSRGLHQGAAARSSHLESGAQQVRWGPGAPPRGPRAGRPIPGAGRPAAAGQDAQPPPGGREELGRRGGARDTERVESGARKRWRRISWARISGATMAFGKSHRDPYATSVGLLIGKEARGKTPGQALGIGVPFPLDSLVGLRRTELVQVGGNPSPPPATFLRHPHSTRPL